MALIMKMMIVFVFTALMQVCLSVTHVSMAAGVSYTLVCFSFTLLQRAV